jgi:chromosome segregation ATPase
MSKKIKKREAMLPAHIFKKREPAEPDIDKIGEIFPGIKKEKKSSDTENESLKAEIESLKAENEDLKLKFDEKLGTKKDLIAEIEFLKAENESLKADVDELLNKEDDTNDSPEE